MVVPLEIRENYDLNISDNCDYGGQKDADLVKHSSLKQMNRKSYIRTVVLLIKLNIGIYNYINYCSGHFNSNLQNF